MGSRQSEKYISRQQSILINVCSVTLKSSLLILITSQLTGGMLSSNFNKKVREFIASDQAFTFMSSINGTPAFWKKILFDVLAMVKQLGVPIFFMTLSSTDLKWNELVLRGRGVGGEVWVEGEWGEGWGEVQENQILK